MSYYLIRTIDEFVKWQHYWLTWHQDRHVQPSDIWFMCSGCQISQGNRLWGWHVLSSNYFVTMNRVWCPSSIITMSVLLVNSPWWEFVLRLLSFHCVFRSKYRALNPKTSAFSKARATLHQTTIKNNIYYILTLCRYAVPKILLNTCY